MTALITTPHFKENAHEALTDAHLQGALVYARKKPDPWPRVFGFHEVFHACTLVGATLLAIVIAFIALPRY